MRLYSRPWPDLRLTCAESSRRGRGLGLGVFDDGVRDTEGVAGCDAVVLAVLCEQ